MRLYYFEYTERGKKQWDASIGRPVSVYRAATMARNPLVEVGPVLRTRHLVLPEPGGPISA